MYHGIVNLRSSVAFIKQKRCVADTIRSNYIDEWHAATVKPSSFYAEQAATGLKRKCYFYSIDLQGRVFLEETMPKNLATSLKNTQFLDIFFRNIRRIGAKEYEYLSSHGAENDYPYVSPCGIEMNYIRPADTAIVFHSLRNVSRDSRNSSSCNSKELCFGGTLTQPFLPAMLVISKRTGRLYHYLSALNEFPTPLHKPGKRQEYGLLKSSLAVTLSEHLVDGTGPSGAQTEDTYSGMDYICMETGERFPIRRLADNDESGPWSLSFQPNDSKQM